MFPIDQFHRFSFSEKDTLALSEPFFDSGINITMDNWFTSSSFLAKPENKNITAVGTLWNDRKEIPQTAKSTANRTTVIHRSQKSKPVLLLSSLHSDGRHGERKPDIFEFYNQTKFDVDYLDHMVCFYSSKRLARRWP